MIDYPIKAKFSEFSLPKCTVSEETVVVPTVKGSLLLKYGKHAYYFYNFKTKTGLLVEISHRAIIWPGLKLFFRAVKATTIWGKLRSFFKKYHYNFSFLEQLMLMTVPHTITSMGEGIFLVNLWSYVGYLKIDCNKRSVSYLRGAGQSCEDVLGSNQWYQSSANELYSIAYSLPDSMQRITSSNHPVPCKITKQIMATNTQQEVWSGQLSDYLHDILVNTTGQYCVACELGMYPDNNNNPLPSKVLIIDMVNKKHWVLEKFIVAAHAQFDPEDPEIIYFSNHNFQFLSSSLYTLLSKATYSLKFIGPAAVYKYKLTEDGPQGLDVFSDPELFRLTNFHVFMHRGKKLLTAMGFPNFIYLVEAGSMNIIKKITVQNPQSQHSYHGSPESFIGTFSPSKNGELLYVQTTRSFQIVNIDSGECVEGYPLSANHTAANHMTSTSDTNW